MNVPSLTVRQSWQAMDASKPGRVIQVKSKNIFFGVKQSILCYQNTKISYSGTFSYEIYVLSKLQVPGMIL